jgi:hypothetical protein
VPGGRLGAVATSALTTAWTVLAVVTLVWPGFGVGLFGTGGVMDDSLPEGWETDRVGYELTQFLPLTFFIALGVVFYVWGARTRADEVEVPLAEEIVPVPV